MKTLGVDFGTKRIGLAISDDEGSFAFPLKTIENNQNTINNIVDLVKDRDIKKLVLGDPGNSEGVKETRAKIIDFQQKLQSHGLDVFLQNETMTSLNSDLFGIKKPIARKWGTQRREKKDESAAALILQRYLDTKYKYD